MAKDNGFRATRPAEGVGSLEEGEGCWVSVISYYMGDRWGDRPSGVDPTIQTLCIAINDMLTEELRPDKAKRKRLKQWAKARLEEESQEFRRLLDKSNPAPLGSETWTKNARAIYRKERELRENPPDRMTALEASEDFLLLPITGSQELVSVPTWYFQCRGCGDLVHSVPRGTVRCACRNISFNASSKQIVADSRETLRWVRLMARA